MLAKHHILPYFSAGALEVHLIFDDPGRFPTSPKAVPERQRRYQSTNADHTHYNFREQLPNTQKWKKAMECTKCKHQLAMHLAFEMLQQISKHLLPNQHFITAGAFEEDLCDKALCVGNGASEAHVLPHLTCSAEEADMKIWLHCTHSFGTKKLVFSPDTDVFHIGMLLLRHTRLSEYEIIV